MEADESIHVRIYIYDNDDYALEIADLLKSRSRDVDVRVLADGLGTIMANGVHPDSVPEDHHAPVSIKRYLKKDSKIRVRYQKNPWLTLDHTKTIIVDHKTAFIGGMNIGREYRYEWHDLMMEVEGPVVNTLQSEFNRAWAYAGLLGDFAKMFARKSKGSKGTNDQNYPIRTLFTRSGDSQIYRAQLEAIRRSQKYIYIQNPYFSDDAMLNELIKARHRGVDVRVIIPRESNWKAMNRSNKLAANTMMENGIRVYLFPVMSHVKAAIYDGWACVGSANFDKASFRTNQEINLATSDPEVVRELTDRLFTPDFERSDLMMKSNPVRFADRISEIIADQL
jgi:cardiolipin synthase